MGKSLPPRIALADLAAEADPYPLYDALRASGPVCRTGPSQWLVTRYDDVARLLRDRRLRQFQISAVLDQLPAAAPARAAADDPAVDFTERILAGQNGDDHRDLRQQMTTALLPALSGLDSIVSSVLDDLLESARQRAGFDAVSDLAHPLPLQVLGRVVGIPEPLRAEAGRRALTLAHVFSPGFDLAERAAVNDAVRWLRDRAAELLAARRANPCDDFISRLAVQPLDRWDENDVVDNVVFVLFAGFETSRNLLANGCDALLDFPDEQRRLRADPGLIPLAVEEFLRFQSPVHITGRLVTEPFHVGTQRIGAGRVVYLGLASANRDGSKFPNPARLDVGRTPNRHVALGGGPHHCLGAAIARQEAATTFTRLMGEFSWLERSDVPRRNRSATLRTVQRLPVSIVA